MATMSDRQSVAANATVQNVLAGKSQEFIRERSIISFFACASAVGLFMTAIVGDEVVVEDQEVNAQNRMPIIPDDFLARAGGLPGDRVVFKVRNSTAGAITSFIRVEVMPR